MPYETKGSINTLVIAIKGCGKIPLTITRITETTRAVCNEGESESGAHTTLRRLAVRLLGCRNELYVSRHVIPLSGRRPLAGDIRPGAIGVEPASRV